MRGSETLRGGMLKSAATDERLLVAEARSGSSSAFGQLYERHRLRIYQTAYRILRDHQDAEDAVQRSFQRAFTNLSRFRGDSTFSTWLTRIAINEGLMLLRHRRTTPALLTGYSNDDYESSGFDVADKAPTPEDVTAENELRSVVIQAVFRLRKSLRIVILRQLRGLTIAQTARHLGLSIAAVKARTFHARRQLRRHIERKLEARRNPFLRKNSDVRWTLFRTSRSWAGSRARESEL